ncbi:LysR family transcriptional regulator [Kitasatospora paranensis]|uniref:helix-turn-helix domain-containing protein n=1 Tax=Kitasatospora paranensis TaxID=258053 RepID=UPI0031E8A666
MLHVAQQALSRDVRALERQLGEVLFHRTTRSVVLTPAGSRCCRAPGACSPCTTRSSPPCSPGPCWWISTATWTAGTSPRTGCSVRPGPRRRTAICWPVSSADLPLRRASCSRIGWTCRSAGSPGCRPGCAVNSLTSR